MQAVSMSRIGVEDKVVLDCEPASGCGGSDLPSIALQGSHESDTLTGAAHPGVRRVLVIASRFPPVASVGAIRVRKFVKYLPLHGWQATVITGAMRRQRPSCHDVRRAADYESLLDLPYALPVHRLSPVWDNWPAYAARWLSGAMGRIARGMGLSPPNLNSRLLWRFRRLHDRGAFPDRGIWRLPAVLAMAAQLHRRHHFDAIYTSGMPFSDHLIGLAVHELLRRPWLADFRDPWVEYIHWKQWDSRTGRRMTELAESAVMRRAKFIISVNDPMTRRFRERYGDSIGRKCVTIPNGFDPSDYGPCEREGRSAEFRMLYAGSLYGQRSPERALGAWRAFIAGTPGSEKRARFEFAGRPGPFAAMLEKAGADGTVRVLGMLSHTQAARAMRCADVNVVLLPQTAGGDNDTTAKIYECLGSGRPLLAVVPPGGAAATELREMPGVWLCAPDDVEGIGRAIRDLYLRWLSGGLGEIQRGRRLDAMTRQRQAARLAALLNSATRCPRPVERGTR